MSRLPLTAMAIVSRRRLRISRLRIPEREVVVSWLTGRVVGTWLVVGTNRAPAPLHPAMTMQ